MSYGRDTSQLPRAGSFRQMGGATTQKPKTKGTGTGGGGFLRWRDVYRPSMIKPDVVRLLRGQYMNLFVPLDEEGNVTHQNADGSPQVFQSTDAFYKYTEHRYARTDRTNVCSAGPLVAYKDLRDPCLGCDEYYAGWKKLRDDNGGKAPPGKKPPMGKSDHWALSVLHYANYHNAPQTDAKGNLKINKQTGDPYMEWSACKATYGYPCPSCKESRETKLGHVMHWPMGFGHWNVVLNLDAQVGESCSNCGGLPIETTPGTRISCIQSSNWLCPSCDESVIDLTSTTHTPEQILKMTRSQVVCPHCSQPVFLIEYLTCRNCSQAKRATLFDVDLSFMRIKQGQGDSETTILQPSTWSPPRSIDQNFIKIATPLDLLKIYGPTPLDIQAKDFQLPLPQGYVVGGGQAAPAAGPPVTAAEAARPYTVGPQMPGADAQQTMYKP